jgi:NAD(P)-dependent dehydrogenase (short-subunit alcohol dehydrogenase family)
VSLHSLYFRFWSTRLTTLRNRGSNPEELATQFRLVMDTNVLSTIHLYNLFMPQILKGKVKKVVLISSGMGDMEWVRDYDLETSALYGTSKAALNMISAKYSAQYKKDGVLFLSICPGMVDVGYYNDCKIQPSAPGANEIGLTFSTQ